MSRCRWCSKTEKISYVFDLLLLCKLLLRLTIQSKNKKILKGTLDFIKSVYSTVPDPDKPPKKSMQSDISESLLHSPTRMV
jgi:hypothetical protein